MNSCMVFFSSILLEYSGCIDTLQTLRIYRSTYGKSYTQNFSWHKIYIYTTQNFYEKKEQIKNTKPKNFTNENKLSQKIVCKSITLDCYSRCEYTKQAIVNAWCMWMNGIEIELKQRWHLVSLMNADILEANWISFNHVP